MRMLKALIGVLATTLIAAACSTSPPEPTPVPTSTATPEPTATSTPVPTPTPAPTSTPVPTETPAPDPTATPQIAALFEYSRAIRLLEVQEFDDAVTAFDLVIRKLPDFSRAYYGRGRAFHGDERVDLALEDFATAIDLEPDFPGTYVARALIYVEQENREGARADLETALEVANEIRDAGIIAAARRLLAELK